MRKIEKQRGQVGLLVLLLVSLLMALGLSVATRSISEVQLSRTEEDSSRGFNVADAGIEDLISQDLSTFINNYHDTFNYTTPEGDVIPVERDLEWLFVLEGVDIPSGHSIQVNLEGVTSAIQIRVNNPSVCWGYVVTAIDGSGNVRRFDAKKNDAACLNGSGLTAQNTTWVINNLSGYQIARIKAFNTTVNVDVTASGGLNLPAKQAYRVGAQAKLADGTARAIETKQVLPMVPSIFDYVLFSGNTITK